MVKVFKEDKEIPPIKIGANVKERASLVAQTVKNLPAMRETWVQSLGWDDPLEEGVTTTPYSCLENPQGQRGLAGYSPQGHKESGTIE